MSKQKTKTSTTLRRALRILRTDGWTTGTMKCGDGKVCSAGAIAQATGDLVLTSRVTGEAVGPDYNGPAFYDVREKPSKDYERGLRALASVAWQQIPKADRPHGKFSAESKVIEFNDYDVCVDEVEFRYERRPFSEIEATFKAAIRRESEKEARAAAKAAA